MDSTRIRNFTIIAHIDHGKSTLADRMLEITHTVEARKMKEQVLDSMELERERGITIKMQPVRMKFGEYILNLIDTPGHIDFSYEVSRALKAVEGSILLVDATQGVQAQTLTTLNMARELGLKIIPVLSKIDSPLARVADIKTEVARVLDISEDEILECSGKTGEGVPELLQEVIKRIPPPQAEFPDTPSFRSIVFDFQYSDHRGVIVYIRVTDGMVSKKDSLLFSIANRTFSAIEIGTFSPAETPADTLKAGEIGYIVTGIKEPGIASVGDTITSSKQPLPALGGYMSPRPVVWASIYPESQDDFPHLRLSLGRLKLSDSSLTYEEETSGTLGRGFRCGFLGMLHLEIISERLRREFNLDLIVTTPSITYEVELKNHKKETVYSPVFFPDDGLIENVLEPWATVKIITPAEYLGTLLQILYDHEAEVGETETFGESHSTTGVGNRTSVTVEMPLREMMRNFFDEVKSATAGYASVSYEISDMRPAEVTRLDILVADEPIQAFSRVVARRRVQEEAEKAVARLHSVLPRQMFVVKIQGKAFGRILASETLSGMKKDVTQHMYGGDITRKMKLREKQKKGKKKMLERGRGNVNIPHDVFLKMMRTED
ncbi:MAG: lepA [Candidatus Paceibacter sp.]|jgi:GTP-binding protein LepA|nr:lepA [Candidatus Paceibacter sp.]